MYYANVSFSPAHYDALSLMPAGIAFHHPGLCMFGRHKVEGGNPLFNGGNSEDDTDGGHREPTS